MRIRGGTCLEQQLGDESGVELSGESADAPEKFLQGLDVFFYRTRDDWYEAFGRVVLEAMACGVVVIAENRGGYVELVEHGKTGFLFKDNAEALEYFTRLQEDPALLAELKQASRPRALELMSTSAGEALRDRFTTV